MLVSFIFLLFCFIAILYKFYISNSNSIVCLKNNKIEFYDNSKLKRISAYCYLKKDICKEMWGFGLGITKINIEIKISFLLLFLLFLCWFFISEDKIYILLVFPFIFLGNLLLKIIICFVLESKNRRFSPFAGIAIDKMYFLEIKHLPEVFHIHQFGLYCMIYIFNNLEYDQIKEYFLITKDINIDKIQKKYFL